MGWWKTTKGGLKEIAKKMGHKDSGDQLKRTEYQSRVLKSLPNMKFYIDSHSLAVVSTILLLLCRLYSLIAYFIANEPLSFSPSVSPLGHGAMYP